MVDLELTLTRHELASDREGATTTTCEVEKGPFRGPVTSEGGPVSSINTVLKTLKPQLWRPPVTVKEVAHSSYVNQNKILQYSLESARNFSFASAYIAHQSDT